MLNGLNDNHQTMLPAESSFPIPTGSESPAKPMTDEKTMTNRWVELLAFYVNLLAQPSIRRESLVTIEEYARENGLWLMLDSVPGEVVAAEIKVRQAVGETVRRQEYASRFPHLLKELDGFGFSPPATGGGQATHNVAGDDTASTIVQKPTGNEPSDSSMALSIGGMFGQYRIERELGQGGMGAVYLATHAKLDKQVALKILPRAFTADRDLVLRFEREMRSLGRVDHPNIVRAFDAGEINGVQYLAMEFVEGADLQKMVAKLGPCEPELACKLVAQTAAGLEYAHKAHLVHRDIKPLNILVTKDGTVKIVDMGLARILAVDTNVSATEQLTLQQQMMGTPDYMAPEQWANAAEADGRADLYSLGCTLYFLLSGSPPFGGKETQSVAKKMKAHLASPAPSLKAVRDDIPDALVELYQKLMAKDPDRRPNSATEVIAAINRIYPQSEAPNSLASLVDPKQLKECIAAGESTGRSGVPLPWLLGIGGAFLGACLALGWMFADREPRPTMSLAPEQAFSVQSKTASIGVEVIQKRSETDLVRRGMIGRQIDGAKLGDLVKLTVRLTKPSYCYVVALNPTADLDWKTQLLYPASSDLTPTLSDSLTIPAKGTSFIPLTDGSGQQVYVVIESTKPLPTFDEWRKTQTWDAEWQPCQRAGVWQFVDGDLSMRPLSNQDRAAIVDIAPPELSNVLEKLKASSANADQRITAVAFPIAAPLSRNTDRGGP